MKEVNSIVLVGSGTSMKNHIEEIKPIIDNAFSIGCNINYRFFNNTIQVFKDLKFYNDYKDEVDKLPLVITDTEIDKKNVNKNILKLAHNVADYTGWEKAFTEKMCNRKNGKGLWCNVFTGIYILSMAIGLLKGKGTIYLLGYDFTNSGNISKNGKNETHFFQENEIENINYGGYGKIQNYDKTRITKLWSPFLREMGIKIYNVTDIPDSKIFQFQKINYKEFINKMSNTKYNQDELRLLIKDEIKGRLKENV